MKVNLRDLKEEEIIEYMESIGEKSFRGKQVFEFVNNKKVLSIDEITNISKELRESLTNEFSIYPLNIFRRFDSQIDKTRKYLFETLDGHLLESVFLSHDYGNTVCISTQIGCRMNCAFCASGKAGLFRDLTPGEMSSQIYEIENDLNNKISNIVLMGSGEPLDNLENVLSFLEIITSDLGKNISARNITLSTCGLVPEIIELADLKLQITLALSLHSPWQSKREKIMPVGKKYNLSDVLEACSYYQNVTGRRVSVEYVLIRGENDSEEDAIELSKILKDRYFHINLIPLNPVEEFRYEASKDKNIKNFLNVLNRHGINATIRRELGRDIDAACGQLRNKYREGG